MASTLISPGVLAIENDQSFLTQQPVTVGAAIIGPTVKGPVEIPTVVTSYSQYQNLFGTTFTSASSVYTYFTSIAAYNYFANGGESLLVARVVSASDSWASATTDTGSVTGTNGVQDAVGAPVSIMNSASFSQSFALETISMGAIMNSVGTTGSNGVLDSGSTDNLRWVISNPDTANGTFSLIIRQASDDNNNQSVLETWTNLSLDPKADNYISKIIGDQSASFNGEVANPQITIGGEYPNASRYVRVKSVDQKTPDYFNNSGTAKPEFTGSIPAAGSGSFIAGVGVNVPNGANKYYNEITGNNTQGLSGSDYTNMIALLSNQDDYQFNLLVTPGLFNNIGTHNGQITNIINNTQNRGDNIFVVDLAYYGTAQATVITQAAARNTSYAAAYRPWLQTIDPDTGARVWVPASTMIPGVYAYNDSVSEPWFAPAGINRGGLTTVIRAEQKLSQTNRDSLYVGKVNPIATFPGTGVVVYGQKTLQTRASALDRVNVRRLLIALKSYISQVANNLVFEQNTAATRNSFLAQVNPYLTSVQQKQGLYAFRVIMDDTNNTADVIDRNQLVGQIYIQPTKTAEFIYLNFNILPTGVEFPA